MPRFTAAPKYPAGRFPQIDVSAFSRTHKYRHLRHAVEVVRWGKVVGYWFPVDPIQGEVEPLLESQRSRGLRSPYKGTAAYSRVQAVLEALDEADDAERALRDALLKAAKRHDPLAP